MTTTNVSKNNIDMEASYTTLIKQCAHLYDINNNPKILPEKYAVSKAELIEYELHYDHTPSNNVHLVEEARLPMTP
jgi:hypothetical protein